MYINARADVKKKATTTKNPPLAQLWGGGGVTLFKKQINFDDIKRYECTDL